MTRWEFSIEILFGSNRVTREKNENYVPRLGRTDNYIKNRSAQLHTDEGLEGKDLVQNDEKGLAALIAMVNAMATIFQNSVHAINIIHPPTHSSLSRSEGIVSYLSLATSPAPFSHPLLVDVIWTTYLVSSSEPSLRPLDYLPSPFQK